ncbi:AraC family transcriptional regulator [Paraburkholderia sp. LEh10]|uniref:AraC family transcriptional regulator n=1 Tax=Paraburkholderia sp. LEh10 TaxID=2821353 RepID=UPI001AE3EE35|nr:AraC family transcriptional regulator [Paraburkholderia sp. LEh10]MBP0590435.1 AraC family transcriptional regulator [Paraburkholderia sp. LEh10]
MILEPDESDLARKIETQPIRERLALRIAAYVGDVEERSTTLPGLSFAKVMQPTAPTSYLYDPSLSMIIRGRKRVRLGEHVYIYDESRFLLTAVNLPTVTEVLEASPERPYISLLMRLDLQAARQTIADVDTRKGPPPASGFAMATGPATPQLYNAIERLIDLLDSPDDLAHLGALIQRELIYRILTSPAGARLRETVLLGTQSQKTAKAIAWLRENFKEPLRVEELAEMAGMGVSTLHHHFRAMTAMSPVQYQKQLRLHEARRLLLGEDIDAATAAMRVGYESATQFSREYRRMFGAPPIRDVTPLRSVKGIRTTS